MSRLINVFSLQQMKAEHRRCFLLVLATLAIYIVYLGLDTALQYTIISKPRFRPKKAGVLKWNSDKNSSYDKHRAEKVIAWYVDNFVVMADHSTRLNLSYCSFKNCIIKYIFSENGAKPNMHFDADAIIIPGTSISKLPPPPRRDKNQVFVLAARDAAGAVSQAYSTVIGRQWVNAINWTMTFRQDSDILYTYSSITKQHVRNNFTEEYYNEIFRGKEKKVAWFVSHCHTKSHREDYVELLQREIDVDIYGGCGKPSCHKGDGSCFKNISRKYKFYLAFENTFFTDYVTEKLFSWFKRDIITVVRGGSNYSDFVPPGTVIDASEFRTAAQLGKYLNIVATNKELYLSYLKRKDNYFVNDKLHEALSASCKVCEYVNTPNYHRKTYSNISAWWVKNRWDYT